jgi:hypothetical protein
MEGHGVWGIDRKKSGSVAPTTPVLVGSATDKNTSPQPVNTTLKDAQLSRVPRHRAVLVITRHSFPKPGTDLGHCDMFRR